MNAIDVAFATACTALLGATVGPFVSMRIARAQIGSTVVSANRQKWIEGLRDAIASFCSQAVVASLIRARLISQGRFIAAADPDLLGRLQDLLRTFHRIELMTNPSEEEHRLVLSSFRQILALLRTAPTDVDLEDDVRRLVEAAIGATQIILKKEWDRVKRGS